MTGRIGFVWLLACAAWAASAIGADGPPGTGAIVGRVVNPRGGPIAGAEVWGVSLRKEVGRTKSDADGRYRLSPVPTDKEVEVWFGGDGLARERREGVHVFEGRDVDLGPMVLVPGTRLSGRVVDAKGNPVPKAGVSIEVYRRVLAHTIDANEAQWEVAGDAEGRFRTASLPAGEAQLTFVAPGKVRTAVDRRTLPGTAEVDLGDVKLEDEVPIRGVVVDKSGKPAPKVEVQADYDYKNRATTDAEGKFTLGGAGRDAKELRLESNDYFAPKPFPIGPDRENLRLEVTKSYEIKGTAVDAETGALVPIETVRLCIVVHEPDGTTSLRG